MQVWIVRTHYDAILSIHSTLELAESARVEYLKRYDTWPIHIVSGYVIDEMWEG